MNGMSISAMLALAKPGETQSNGKTKALQGLDGKAVGLFSNTLKQTLLNNKKESLPKGLKEILNQLMDLLKNPSVKSKGKGITEANAKQVLSLLKKAVVLLEAKRKDTSNKKDPTKDVEFLAMAMSQIQQWLSPEGTQVPEKEKNKAGSLKGLTDQIEKVVQNLLEDEKVPIAKPQSSVPTKTTKSFVVRQQPKNEHQLQDVKVVQSKATNGDKKLAAQNVNPVGTGKQMDPKEIAVHAFQKLSNAKEVHRTDQTNPLHSGPMTKLEQYVLHVKPNNSPVSQQQFVHDFEQLLAKGTFTSINGKQQLTLQLHPRNLGTLNIQLTKVNGQLTATLVTTTNEAKQLVESNLQQLQGAFASQNLNVQKLQVVFPFAQSNNPSQQFGDGGGKSYQGQQDAEQQHGNEKEEDTGQDNWLDELRLQLEQEVIR